MIGHLNKHIRQTEITTLFPSYCIFKYNLIHELNSWLFSDLKVANWYNLFICIIGEEDSSNS